MAEPDCIHGCCHAYYWCDPSAWRGCTYCHGKLKGDSTMVTIKPKEECTRENINYVVSRIRRASLLIPKYVLGGQHVLIVDAVNDIERSLHEIEKIANSAGREV